MRNVYLAVGILVVLVIIFAVVRVVKLPKISMSPKVVVTPAPTTIASKEELIVTAHTPANTAVVDKVTLQTSGFVVIHEEKDGQPGEIIGASTLLTPGTHENVIVQLKRKTLAREKLVAMVHKDNGDGIFDGATDAEDKDESGKNLQAAFQVQTASESSSFQIPATGLGEDSTF